MIIERFLTGLIVLVVAIILPFTGSFVDVPEPAVKEGRFDFSVTYEINGEETTVSGVYVCKYKKPTVSLDGYSRIWDGYIEGSDIKDENRHEVLENEYGVIYFDFGLDPRYFMSDYPDGEPYPSFLIVYRDEIAEEMGYFSVDPEVLETYGVKVISYEYGEPVENSFE